MQTFPLHFTSRVRFVFFILVGILLSGGLIGLLGFYAGLGDLTGILIIAATIFVFYKAPRFSKQQANFSITEEALHVEWISGPAQPKDRQIAWQQIASYKLEADRLFDAFVLKLHTGETLQFSMSKLNEQERHFRDFYRAFIAKVESLEQAGEKGVSIKKAKTFYETTFGIVFILLLALCLIGAILYKLYTVFF